MLPAPRVVAQNMDRAPHVRHLRDFHRGPAHAIEVIGSTLIRDTLGRRPRRRPYLEDARFGERSAGGERSLLPLLNDDTCPDGVGWLRAGVVGNAGDTAAVAKGGLGEEGGVCRVESHGIGISVYGVCVRYEGW